MLFANRFTRQDYRRAIAYLTTIVHLLMVAAVFLPLCGTWFDRDFAARQPGHGHLYLGEVDLDHHHGGDHHGNGHHHHETAASCVEAQTIFLPSRETLGQGWAFVLPMSGLLFFTATLCFALDEAGLSRKLLFIPPLDKPPQGA